MVNAVRIALTGLARPDVDRNVERDYHGARVALVIVARVEHGLRELAPGHIDGFFLDPRPDFGSLA